MSEPLTKPSGRRAWWRTLLWVLFGLLLLVLLVAGALVVYEMETSRLQARYLSALGREMTYELGPGASPSIRFPSHGPFDERMGYVGLPGFQERLVRRGFEVKSQARMSPRMTQVVDQGLFVPFREKAGAGLTVRDCAGGALYSVRYPERAYAGFDAVPRLLVDSLLFIENRELLSNREPTKNPAVEWDRFIRAGLQQVEHRLGRRQQTSGGSTLATQIEKYRHSPEGRTDSGEEKLRQMVSASLRAYLDGPDTTAARRRLVVDYLNTVPLAASPGFGEVNGIGDGLWVWYGLDFAEFNRLMQDPAAAPKERALAYKQALSLLIAQRRPSGYLAGDLADLSLLTDVFLGLMADGGVIPPALRDAALPQALVRRKGSVPPPRESFVARKAATTVRNQIAALLGAHSLYELDRLDLDASSTLDARLQASVTQRLQSLGQRGPAEAAGLMAERLLAGSDPARVTYSFTLFERTPSANVVRLQVDTLDQPFDVNEGTKLDLGSTAKLRTLVSYLEIVAQLHARLEPLTPEQLQAVEIAERDAIGRWAVDYFITAPAEARGLDAMLEASLERRYAASPREAFFTGGTWLTFENFDKDDDPLTPTIREALQRSVNLVFIRLMRDIVYHTMSALPGAGAALLEDVGDPRRRDYLARFADREGRELLAGFYRKYRGRPAAEAEALLLQGVHPTPRRLATVFRSLRPAASVTEFAAFMRASLPEAVIPEPMMTKLYKDYSVQRFSLADRGYIAGVHPLELWLVAYLRAQPAASLKDIVDASREERQAVYGWLFRTRHKGAQDLRIRALVELEAFMEIHKSWQRLGYPFGALSPSYATALGSSGDRPAALAELMGILVNDGMRQPTLRIDALDLAVGTPFETHFALQPEMATRVLPAEVARAARRALAGVVDGGTGRRVNGVFTARDGTPLLVGGKTGTGDHRFETYGRGGVLLSSRVVSRSGTFVFFVGDRHFGTLTAYVQGPEAANYQFTSALPTQILTVLAPLLQDEFRREARVGTSCAADAPLLPRPPVPVPPIVPEPDSGPPIEVRGVEPLDTVPQSTIDLPDVPTPEPSQPEPEPGTPQQ